MQGTDRSNSSGGETYKRRAIPLETGGGFFSAISPGWSPDGTRMVFSLFLDQTGQEDIYKARSDGTDLINHGHGRLRGLR